jgi:hypothetical protein
MSEFYTSVGGDGASGVVILRLKAQAIASQTSVNACDGSTTLNGVKVAAAHPKIFYIDSDKDQKLDANYMAYRVTSTTARSDLWVQVSGFTGGSVTLANSADSSQPVGTIAANGTGAVYFLAKASEETNKAQSHVVKVFDRKPGSGAVTPLFTCNSGFSQVAETIKAEANKVDAITTSSVSSIGTTFTITVLGDSGTIGNGNATDGRMLWLSPASRSTWPTGALRLEDTVITTYSDAARATVLKTFSNSLALNTSSGLSANNRQYYKAVYTFRIIGNATSVASISPSAMISSGTQVKHVSFDKLPTGTSSKVNVVNPTQTVTVAGSASSTAQVRNNGTTRVTYTLTIKNTGSKDVELDELYDRGDDGDDEDDEEEDHEKYVKGSTKKNGEEHEDGEEDDDDKQKHVFSGPFKIPAKSSITIEYQVDVKTCQKGEKYKKEHKSGGSIGGSDDDEDEDHDGHDDDGDGDHDGDDDDEDHGHKIGSSKTTRSNVEVTGKCGEPAQAVKVTNQVQDPVVKTGTAVPVAATSATLYGTVDPNGVSGLPVKFSYSTSPSLVGATTVNLANTTSAGDPYVVKSSITGLTPGTRYYYRLTVVQPGNVEKSGAIYHLDTELLPGVPTAETAPVTLISNSDKGALFTGAITAARVAGGAKVRFEWAADTSNGACTSVGSVSNSGNLKNGSSDAVLTNAGATDMTHRVTGFTASAKYCVRIVALHGTGYTTRVVGGWVAFTQAPKTTQSISWNNVMPPLPAGGSTTVAATATTSLAVTYTSVDPTVCSVNPSTGAVSAVADFGLCSITATQDGDDTYYPALPKTISFEIVPPKVVTSSLPAGEYQSALTSTTLEAEGGNGTYSNWSVVGTLPAGLTLSSQGVLSGTPTAAGLYTITVTVESNGVTSAPRDLSIVIETASIAVIANDATVTFGDAVPAIGYTVSSFLSGDSALNTAPKCETNYQVGDAAGATGKATFCADAWDPNYTVTYVSGELTVEKFAVVVAASAKAKQNLSNGTNRPDPAFEYTLTPALPGGQTVADVLPAGVNFSRSSGEAPGNYSITPSAASTGSNYDVTFVDGTLTVQQPQIVPALTATDFEVTFGEALGVGLVADAKDDQTDVSGTWVFSYVDENNQIQVVTSATELPAGLYTITAEFTPTDGATFYGPVSTVMNLKVNKKVVTITSEEAEKLVNSLDPDLEYTAAGFLGRDTLDDLGQVLVTREPGEAPGTYDVTTSGGSNPNYTVQHVKATLFITKLTIVPVVNADGSNARQVSVTCQGAKPGSTVTLTIGAVTLGTYTVAANGTCAATKLTIPSSIPDGPHTITAAGEFPSGASLSDSTPALFVAPPVNNGGNTGGNTGGNSGGGVVVKPGKLKATKTFSGFRPGSHHLTTAMKSQLRAWVAANPKLNRLTCTGFTMGKTVLPIDEKLSWNRAFFACQYVKQIKPSVKIVWVKGKQETVFGDPIRRVELTLTNY